MSVGSTEPWARLRLVSGESTAQGWELVASLGQTTLTVGSGAQSTWQVRAAGVLPVHVSLLWDGAALRVADAGGSGDVRVDGVPVGSAWVSVSGHQRLEFGTAALMVDTSAPRAGQSDHPLEPGSVPPARFSEPVSGAMPRLHKATLLGVAASDLPAARAGAVAKTAASDAAASAGTRGGRSPSEPPDPAASDLSGPAPGDTEGFRLARPSDSERVRKATLLGAAISVPPPAPPGEAPLAATPSRGLSTGTLMGVVGPMGPILDPRASSGAGGSPRGPAGEKLGDVRTIIGMPLSDSTIRGALGVAATQTELRPIAATPPGERIASTWQEDAGSARPSLPPELPSESDPLSGGARYAAATPSASRVVDPARMASQAHGSARPGVAPHFDPRQTGPDANLQPKRSFPLQYVGIVVLTCAAYFAWLYLLDHW